MDRGHQRYSSRRNTPRRHNSSNSWRRNKNKLEIIQQTRERRKEEDKENKQFEIVINQNFKEQNNGLTRYEEIWLTIETNHERDIESSDDDCRLSW